MIPVSHITKEEKAFRAHENTNIVEYGYWRITLEKHPSLKGWWFEVSNPEDGMLDQGYCKSKSEAIEFAKMCADNSNLYPKC